MPKNGIKIVARNKKARHDYTIIEKYEAGIVLKGTEVKSVRLGKVNLKDSYARFRNGEMFLEGVHISPYEQGNIHNVDPLRTRKLLMHKTEIVRLESRISREGLTIVPLSFYFAKDKVKVELGLAKGKKKYDKREDMKRKEATRKIERNLHRRR